MGQENVSVDFQAGGIAQVQRAYQSVEQALLALERRSVASAARETKARIGEVQKSVRAREAAEKKLFATLIGGERDALAATLRAEREKIRASEMSSAARGKAMRELLRESERMERELTSIVKQEIRSREAAEQASLHRSKQMRSQFKATFGGAIGNGVGNSIGKLANYGGMALGIVGGFSMASVAQKTLSAEAASVALANSMYQGKGDKEQQAWLAKNGKNGRFDPKALMDMARANSLESGIDKGEILSGWQSYMALSSDWKSMVDPKQQKKVRQLAVLTKSQGANFGEVMGAAGSMRMQNPDLTADGAMDIMLAAVAQGKAGAVEFADIAKHGSTITASSTKFNTDQASAQAALLGLSQIARRASGDPAIAATSVGRFASDVSTHYDKAKAFFPGYDPVADKKTGALKMPSEILANIYDVTKGNTTLMGAGHGHIGLGLESIHVAQGEQGIYASAVGVAKRAGLDEKTAHKAGVEAVRKDVQKYENAKYDESDVAKDHALVMEETQERYATVMRDLTEKMEARMIPVLLRLADVLERNAPQIERFMTAIADSVDYLIENPWKGIGKLIALSIGVEIGKAGIATAVQTGMKALFSSPGALTIAAPIMTIGLAYLTVKEMWDEKNAEDSKAVNDSTAAFAEAKNIQGRIADGTATEADLKRAKELSVGTGKQVGELKATENQETMMEQIERSFLLYKDIALTPAAMGGANVNNHENQDVANEQQAARTARRKQAEEAQLEAMKALTMALNAAKNGALAANPNNPARGAPLTAPARGGTGNH